MKRYKKIFEEDGLYMKRLRKDSYDAYSLFKKYKKDWVFTSSYENFVKKNMNIIKKQVAFIKNADHVINISDPKQREVIFKKEMGSLKKNILDVWHTAKKDGISNK